MTATMGADQLDLLVFELESRRFGLPASAVDELVHAVAPTPMPDEPSGGLEGVIDLRGRLVPVLDLRRRLGLPAKETLPSDHLVIIQDAGRRAAVRVDRSLELARSSWCEAEGTPNFGPVGGWLAGVARNATHGIVPVLSITALLEAGREARR